MEFLSIVPPTLFFPHKPCGFYCVTLHITVTFRNAYIALQQNWLSLGSSEPYSNQLGKGDSVHQRGGTSLSLQEAFDDLTTGHLDYSPKICNL